MTLSVYLHNKLCGRLSTTSDRGIVFSYDENYLLSPDAFPLSISLPLQKNEFSQKECLPYFSGLLPEGQIKSQISQYLHVSDSSTVKLLEALGGECAGTVVFAPDDQPSLKLEEEYELDESNYYPISENEISALIDKMEVRPFVFSQKNFRLSLAGAQQKIALAWFDGKWFVPKGNAPSTHIIKPSRLDFTDIAQNEYFSIQLARIFGVAVPDSFLLDFCGKKVFCVKRFDRIQSGKMVRRVHQEDFCQALGIMDDKKYQADGGPSVKDSVSLLTKESSNPIVDINTLLRSVIFQFLIGNCDAHGKNFSLLESKDSILLSPSYDIVSTAVYSALTRNLSMRIGNEYEMDKVRRKDFTELADKIGIRNSVINSIFDDFEKKIPQAEKFLKEDSVAVAVPDLAKNIWTGFLQRWQNTYLCSHL